MGHAGIASDHERAQHFIRIWTLKEAHVKAVGRGIMAAPGMRAFAVSITSPAAASDQRIGEPDTIRLEPGNDEWAFVLFKIQADHVGAVCVQRPKLPSPSRLPSLEGLQEKSTCHLQHPFPLRMWATVPCVSDDRTMQCEVLALS